MIDTLTHKNQGLPMQKGQKVYTTFYGKRNFIGTVSTGVIQTSIFHEDGKVIEDQKIDILANGQATVTVDAMNIKPYNDDSELPEMFFLPVADQFRFANEEKKLAELQGNKVTSHVTFNGENGLPTIKRVFTGSSLEVKALADHTRAMLLKVGYNGMSTRIE